MSDKLPTIPKPLIPERHREAVKNNIRGKVKQALDAMVFGAESGEHAGEALSFDKAAKLVGFSVRRMRVALERPHVRAYLKAQREVFRACASAQNISVLVKLRDESGNGIVQLGAVKQIEAMGEGASVASGPQHRAGMVIVVVNSGGAVEPSLNKPTITIDMQGNTNEGAPFGGERLPDDE